MNDNLQELIEKLVYKTADENGWAPQNKLGQYLARHGRSVKELGYEKMSNFFIDHPERFIVEKDEHGLPVVKLIGEPPVGDVDEIENEGFYQQQQPRQYNNFHRQPSYNDYNRPINYGNKGYQNSRYPNQYPMHGYRQPMNPYRERMSPMMPYRRNPEHLSLFRWAFFPDREEWLQMLADLAKEQVWQYEGGDPQHPNPALFDYLRDTFRQLQIEGKVLESRAEGLALFNTGLLDREEGRPIYAVFGPNPNRNRQPWLFQEFFLSSAPLLAAARNEQQIQSDERDSEYNTMEEDGEIYQDNEYYSD